MEGIAIAVATVSTNENGTPTNFQDDSVSATGGTILRKSSSEYAVKYDVPIAPGGSVAVHLTYQALSIESLSIRPTIRISLSTPDLKGGAGIGKIELGLLRDVMLSFTVRAGRDYRLEYRLDMKTWSPWLTPIPTIDFPRTIQFVDDGLNTGLHPSESPKRFYHLADLSPP